MVILLFKKDKLSSFNYSIGKIRWKISNGKLPLIKFISFIDKFKRRLNNTIYQIYKHILFHER